MRLNEWGDLLYIVSLQNAILSDNPIRGIGNHSKNCYNNINILKSGPVKYETATFP